MGKIKGKKETRVDFQKGTQNAHKLLVFIPGISGGVGSEKYSFLAAKALASGYDYLAIQPWEDGEDIGVYSISSVITAISQSIHDYINAYDQIDIVGKSIGGTLALLLKDQFISSITTWAPVFTFQEGELGGDALIERVVDTGLPESFFNNAVQKNIIYGTGDPNIYPESYQQLRSSMLNIELFQIEGADHSFTDKKKELLDKTFGEIS